MPACGAVEERRVASAGRPLWTESTSPRWHLPCNGFDVDIVPLLDRCVALERGAAEVYETLGTRLAADAELRTLFATLATQERGHATKLNAWRALAAAEPIERRPHASGFEQGVAVLERLLPSTLEAARDTEDVEKAFALALALESSELDAIYTTLLQSSPIARFPDFHETVRRETTTHHELLLDAVRRRSQDEGNRLRAALLAARERGA